MFRVKATPGHEPLDIIRSFFILQRRIMHLILLIAFIVCVAHYGLIRGTGHFIFAIIKAIALVGIFIFGLLFLALLLLHR